MFVTQSLHHWLKALVARPGMESLLDFPCGQIHPSSSSNTSHDVWTSRLWRELRGGDGQLFFDAPGRLGFTLFVDWFNPLGNKQSGLSETI